MSYEFQDKPTRVCPFRKRTSAYYYQSEKSPKVVTSIQHAEWTEEEFMPCLKDKCSAFSCKNIGYKEPFIVETCSLI